MNNDENSLQNLTETELRVLAVLNLPQITPADIADFTPEERGLLFDTITECANKCEGENLEKFLRQIDPITSDSSRNQIWEINHEKITNAIATDIHKYGLMPTKAEIAEATGLSRQTVHKHLKEYPTHPLYAEHVTQFRFMLDTVLAAVCASAMKGDVKAARLFFEMVGGTCVAPRASATGGDTFIQHQNNYVQINGVRLDLNPEQLDQIKGIIGGPQTLTGGVA